MIYVTADHLTFSDGSHISYDLRYGLIKIAQYPNDAMVSSYFGAPMFYSPHAFVYIQHEFVGLTERSMNIYPPYTVEKVMNTLNEFFQRKITRTFKKRLEMSQQDVCIKGCKRFSELLEPKRKLTRMQRRGQILNCVFL